MSGLTLRCPTKSVVFPQTQIALALGQYTRLKIKRCVQIQISPETEISGLFQDQANASMAWSDLY
jgi:hypothetical protein